MQQQRTLAADPKHAAYFPHQLLPEPRSPPCPPRDSSPRIVDYLGTNIRILLL